MTIKERLENIKFYSCVSDYIEHSNKEVVDDLQIGDFQWLIEQVEKVIKIEFEIDNSDMGLAVDNIIKIIKY